MKVIIFGANGKTGRLVTEKALKAGHSVTAFLRDKSKLILEDKNLTIIEGQATNFEDVNKAMKNQEVVISCLGTDMISDVSTILFEMTKNIVKAMKENKVNRFIFTSSAGVENEIPGEIGKRMMEMLKKPLDDHRNAVNEIKSNNLIYTIVRPLGLTEEDEKGSYKEVETGVPENGITITRADVASFIIKSISNKNYENKSISISN